MSEEALPPLLASSLHGSIHTARSYQIMANDHPMRTPEVVIVEAFVLYWSDFASEPEPEPEPELEIELTREPFTSCKLVI